MKQMNEFKDKSVVELTKLLQEKRSELNTTRIKVMGNQEKNVARVQTLKKDIARILTLLSNNQRS